MPNPGHDRDVLKATYRTYLECNQNKTHTAQELNLPWSTLWSRLNKIKELGIDKEVDAEQTLEFPEFPDEHLPADKLVDRMCEQFDRKWAADRAREWFTVKVNDDKPIGIVWMGDPHVDSDGCHWPLLRRHAEIMRTTEGLYGANLGDSTDNWVSRLTRLYAHSNQSRNTGVRLAEILFSELGITWLLLLRGNHDMWSQSRSDDPLTWIAKGIPAPIEDWRARFKLKFKNGREAKIHASHSFSGQSWFHPLHGNIRAALEEGLADVYISGHTHEYGVLHLPLPKRGRDYWLAKARGYKFLDHHALVLGHEPHLLGASVVTIIDPNTDRSNPVVAVFDDVEEAADHLTWRRQR